MPRKFASVPGNLKKKNQQILELLEYFNEETENGKLFISYPMIESIQYTKELPDNQFPTYTVSRDASMGENFKKAAKQFCHYKGYTYLKDLTNWKHLILQNVWKANLLTNDRNIHTARNCVNGCRITTPRKRSAG